MPDQCGKLAALEATDLGLVLDGVDAFQAELFAAAHFRLPLAKWDRGFFPEGAHAFQFAEIGQRSRVLAVTGRVAFIEDMIG